RLMNAGGDGPYALVAVDDAHRLVGLAHYLYHGATWSSTPRCYLNDLFTAPEARGKGVGRKLIEAVYAKADAHGAGQVYWLTQDSNATARRLYDGVAKVTPFIKYVR
ncbi:MAG: GNAT family N-acetyltransferase, partial [Pseudomonadota bacterium]|nr:GNAT family N-acetyltransferase [Pseudomonadota bacterium]